MRTPSSSSEPSVSPLLLAFPALGLALGAGLLAACQSPGTAATDRTDALMMLSAAPAPVARPPRCQAAHQGAPRLQARGVAKSSGELVLGDWMGQAVAIVADADEDALHVVATDSMEVVATTPLPETPGHVAILADGRVAVTLRYANRLALYEPAETAAGGLSPLCDEVVAREPIAIAESGDELLVLAGFGAELVHVDRDSVTVTRRTAVDREPRGLLVRDGAAWISHMVGGVIARVDLETHGVERITTHQAIDAEAPRATQGFDLAAYDAGGELRLLAPQITSADPDPEQDERFRYYGTQRAFSPFVANVIADERKLAGAGGEPSASWRSLCMLPRSALVHEDRLFVACLDKGTVVELDARFMDPMTALYRQYQVAEGPTAIAMRGEDLYVWSRYGHALTRVPVPTLDDRAIHEVPEPVATAVNVPRRTDSRWTAERLRGRELFVARDDERISRSGSSCESCHPDGRDDGLVWGNGHSTLSLAGRLVDTAPYGWLGEAATLEDRVQATFTRLFGSGFHGHQDESDLQALLSYLTSRRPPPPPLPHADREREAIARGARLFHEQLSCAACHAERGSNGSKLSVAGELFDTPSLAFAADSPPFFHDSRYATLDALLADPAQPMDATGDLSADDRGDLASYLRSLPFGAVTEAPALRSTDATSWTDASRRTISDTLVHPGRYLARRPTAIARADIPASPLPYTPSEALDHVWLSLRNSDGRLMGESSLGTTHVGLDVDLSGKILPRWVLSAYGEDALEVQTCTPVGTPTPDYWGGQSYGVVCPEEGVRLPTSQLGQFGLGLRTRRGETEVLLVLAPDTWQRYEGGEIENIGVQGLGWADVHALKLAPGTHAELARVDTYETFWQHANFAVEVSSGIVDVSWPSGAPEPRILVAELTRQRAFGG